MQASRHLLFAAISLLIVLLDWGTKQFMQDWLAIENVIEVAPGFRFVLVHNHGAAFGLLSSAGGWQRGLFMGLAIVVSGYLIWRLWLARPSEDFFNLGLVLILGGAIGNLIDRATLGYVVDFIDLYVGDWHWPAFNVADTAITLGALVVVLDSFGIWRRPRAESVE